MSNSVRIDDWSALLCMEEAERVANLRRFYEDLAQCESSERERTLQTAVLDEYALNDGDLATIAGSRIRAWLTMDDEEARVIATTYDRVISEMPGSTAMRRVKAVQTATLNFDESDVELLMGLIPSVVRQIPRLARRTTALGRLLLNLLASLAEFELEMIRERVKAGMDRARRQGHRIGRPRVTDRRGFQARFGAILERLRDGTISRRQAAKELDIGYATLKRLLDAIPDPSEKAA